MMIDFNILDEMIKSTCCQSCIDEEGESRVCLSEPRPQYYVKILNLPEVVKIIKVDNFKSPNSIFVGKKGENKRADYVIIANYKSNNYAIFIELTKSIHSKSNKEIKQQFKGAMCFFKYCTEIGRTFWGDESFLENYEYRFVSLFFKGSKKTTTRINSRPSINNTPETFRNYFVIDNQLKFRELIGRI